MRFSDGHPIMTAMIRSTNRALASTMRRLRETGDLLEASHAFLNHHKFWKETRGTTNHETVNERNKTPT